MFKRISCVALGVILTSLVSSVGPAYAMTLRGVNSSLTNPNSFGNQPSGLGDVDFGIDTPGLISQGTEVGDGGGDDGLGIVIALAAFAALLALEGGGGSDGDAPPLPPDFSPEPIPTPALLPGLAGLGMAAMRKRKLAQGDQA